MSLLKLIKNRISSEWKDTFNKNIDYLNNLEKRISDENKTTNSRIDNLVLHSGGDSSNEIVDARVNNKGEVFESLEARLLSGENRCDSDLTSIKDNLNNQKEQLEQLNNTIANLYGVNSTSVIYVSAEYGDDKTGTGAEDKPYKTIQAAVNQVPLISRTNVTIYIGSGVYLEDIVVSNISASRMYIRPIEDDSVLDGLTSDMPVKIRSIAFMYCTGYFQIRGMEFVDQANTPIYDNQKYSVVTEQGSYVAINHCSFKENVKNLTHSTIYSGGMSNVNIYGKCTFINQSIIAHSHLMSQITFNTVQGDENDVLAFANEGLIRTGNISIATTTNKTESTGLIITKGTVIG